MIIPKTDKAVLHEATLKHLDSQYEASLWEAKATATQNVYVVFSKHTDSDLTT